MAGGMWVSERGGGEEERERKEKMERGSGKREMKKWEREGKKRRNERGGEKSEIFPPVCQLRLWLWVLDYFFHFLRL